MNRRAILLPSLLVLVASCQSTSTVGAGSIVAAQRAQADSGAADPAPEAKPAAKAKKSKKPTLKELEAQLATL
ncbi:MAG: hypothetical protein VXZ39_15735, partial [Planctomycetota bacterium]|nr:hypothetical protein [Planctomycetota bacterium]